MDNFFKKRNDNAYFLSAALFACGLIIGGAAAALLVDRYYDQPANGKEVLDQVKAIFEADGPIEGSWIELEPVQAVRYNQKQAVYYGGISRKEAGQLVQYEFIADAQQGQIIDIYKI
ncbi:hypothetical protein AWM75_06170 [Aerococcus urinaehominis]|uniref:PepSY domain-containing protein n=1 Tax=Aerococcus urinaehominis TaxID=128944 RepID=A0A0X8FLP3_9LACT|nr:PepSY domain-containing protein [Aerococcus urinaehominis]AMB99590.1 hypothetical protein AWM75_06170 [Aerococcus urinaehominis]SDL86644.1 Predicted small secreted protein [Aerococcus urinaehominis]